MPQQHGHFKKKKEEGGLIITSLIDIFTILTIFLIQNFSAEGNIMSMAENLTLPNSNSKKSLKEINLQVAITHDMILVDNLPVAPTSDAVRIPQDEPSPSIAKLEEKLRSCYAQEEEMVRLGALNKVEGKIVLQIDKNIPFDTMYKVMYTCGKVGYLVMNFAVMQREEG
jgi:biopolymer transport protein ExbD